MVPEMQRSCEGRKGHATHSRVFTEHPQPTREYEREGRGERGGDQWGPVGMGR